MLEKPKCNFILCFFPQSYTVASEEVTLNEMTTNPIPDSHLSYLYLLSDESCMMYPSLPPTVLSVQDRDNYSLENLERKLANNNQDHFIDLV